MSMMSVMSCEEVGGHGVYAVCAELQTALVVVRDRDVSHRAAVGSLRRV